MIRGYDRVPILSMGSALSPREEMKESEKFNLR